MAISQLGLLLDVIHKAREHFGRGPRVHVPGQLQPYNHTLPNRYPWLFQFARTALGDATAFDAVLEAEIGQLASDVKFDRNNRVMRGERYREVAFRKRPGAPAAASGR